MITCVCKNMREREIRQLVRQGADSVEEVGRRCGAGACCGSCRPEIQRIVAEETEREAQLAAK